MLLSLTKHWCGCEDAEWTPKKRRLTFLLDLNGNCQTRSGCRSSPPVSLSQCFLREGRVHRECFRHPGGDQQVDCHKIHLAAPKDGTRCRREAGGLLPLRGLLVYRIRFHLVCSNAFVIPEWSAAACPECLFAAQEILCAQRGQLPFFCGSGRLWSVI